MFCDSSALQVLLGIAEAFEQRYRARMVLNLQLPLYCIYGAESERKALSSSFLMMYDSAQRKKIS
jgi:hypothetical protein